MRKLIGAMTAVAAFLFAANSAHAAAAAAGDAGTGESVKSWGARSWDALKDINKLSVVYICDPKPKKNHVAEKFEGKDLLLNSDVADRLKKCICIKVLTDNKDWPDQYKSMATNGAVLLIMSADKKHVETITRDDTSKVSSDYLVKLLDAMIASDEKFQKEEKESKKLAAATEKKQEEQQKADNGGLAIKGLPGVEDPNAPKKPDTKADVKKPDETKKPEKKIIDE